MGKGKREILGEFLGTTDYCEKAEIRVLNGQPKPKRRPIRNRPLGL